MQLVEQYPDFQNYPSESNMHLIQKKITFEIIYKIAKKKNENIFHIG